VECGSNGLLRKENFTSSSPAPLNFSSHPDNFGKYFLKLNKGKKVVFMLKKTSRNVSQRFLGEKRNLERVEREKPSLRKCYYWSDMGYNDQPNNYELQWPTLRKLLVRRPSYMLPGPTKT
jgi:hypothetical protein